MGETDYIRFFNAVYKKYINPIRGVQIIIAIIMEINENEIGFAILFSFISVSGIPKKKILKFGFLEVPFTISHNSNILIIVFISVTISHCSSFILITDFSLHKHSI